MGKRKYNSGTCVDKVWVVGGVERTEERRVFAVPVEKRDSETLLDVIKKHVAPGSIIHTDLWRGYNGIEKQLGSNNWYSHKYHRENMERLQTADSFSRKNEERNGEATVGVCLVPSK
ncbi:Transposase, ISXO2-like domain-containing protein [Strongyloides ratti]|uniref:Transposase, ISXO2-like domain-containing protein n=1 Tax=Strongyloides ratti TaxID=34506 RepID=A0A090KVJ0_STRRB|nr:Transposase, ISXO2-like domain-containing protein [Strongyloides ratti]CEF61530.1 Transposase, ISXO2-like domain-containing protein [Strongyloides ratti]